ncbi:MAG: hypothetical protein LBF70_01570 [Holosporales bacterium]|jgi:flagellar basal body-associated protein FliL|nr:hypothetical protein [Holosporales bacterium]
MKKWILAIGIILSGCLFLVSGMLIGYVICDKEDIKMNDKNEPTRKPNILNEAMAPFIGNIIEGQISAVQTNSSKDRTPSTQAIQQSMRYK